MYVVVRPRIADYANIRMAKDLTGSSALACLPDDLRAIAMHSSILYAPKPFRWFSRAHSSQLGHLIESENLELPMEELNYEESKLKTYPMVWTNPKTGEKCKFTPAGTIKMQAISD